MPEFLKMPEFWIGAAALCTFQCGKFGELNSIDPRFLRLSHIPNLRASDFAGPQVFAGALVLFLAVTLAIYFVLCWASPTLLIGVAKVTQQQATAEQFAQFTNSIPYPLYIAVGFMGLAQQAVPGLSKIANIQRDVFHYLLGVPHSALLTVDAASAQLFAQGANREQLSRRVETLVGDAWLASLHRYADLSFYRAEIERLKIGSTSEIEEVKNGSARELRYIIEQLVYAAAIATIRKSGKRGLRILARDLSIPLTPDIGWTGPLRTGFVWYLLGLTFLIFAVPMSYPAIDAMAGDAEPVYWPWTVNQSAAYVLSQVAPLLIATVLLVALVPLGQDREVAEERRTAMGLLNRHAGFVLVVIGVVVTFDYLQALFDYGWYRDKYDGRFFDFIKEWFPFHVLHSFISVTACLIIIWHFNAPAGDNGIRGIRPTLSSIVGLVGTVALFYAAARMVFLDKVGLPADYIALIAVLNIIAAVIAFFAVLSVKRRSADMPLAAAE